MLKAIAAIVLTIAGVALLHLAVLISAALSVDLVAAVVLMGLSCFGFAGMLFRRRLLSGVR